MNVDVLVEIARVADFLSHGDEMLEWLSDGIRGFERAEDAETDSDQSADDDDNPGPCAGAGRSFLRILLSLSDVSVRLIQNGRGFGKPGSRVLLKIEDLQVRDGGVTRIDLVALCQKGLGKVVRPTGFGAFHLDKRRAERIASGLRLATLDQVIEFAEAAVHLVFVARIAAQQEIIEIEAILHDLEPNRLSGAHRFERARRILVCLSRHVESHEICDEQQCEHAENYAKPFIKLLSNRHCFTSFPKQP